jgi:hypothetical protein
MTMVDYLDKIKFKKFWLTILILYFSFFFFRGRIGGDDLQAFTVSFNFIFSDLNFIDFFSSDRENAFVLMHRKIWLFQDYLVIKILNFFNYFISFNLSFLSKYFAGYLITLYSVLSFFLFIFFIKKKKFDNLDLCISFFLIFSIYFGSGLVSFFSGHYIESLAFLLFLLKYKFKKYSKNFILDIILINIKPYYLALILGYELSRRVNFNKIFQIKNIFPFIYTFFLTFIFFLPNLLLDDNFSKYQFGFNFNFEINFILYNLFLFFLSPGQGILFTWTIILLIIFFGFNKERTLIKLFFSSIFIIFLCTLPFWNGFAPGNRYLLSILPIFIDEIIICKNFFKNNIKEKKVKFVLIIFFILTIINLPTIEYRNTSIHEYERNTVGKSLNENYVNPDIDDTNIFFIPLDKIDFHHSIFSVKVLVNKIKNNENFQIAGRNLNINAIYPMTSIARVLYIKNMKLNYLEKKMIKIINKLSPILLIIYCVTIFLIILPYFICFKALLKNNLNYSN